MPTLAETAYAALRRDIVSGALAPGLPLRMTLLCDRYDMGMSPLREALNRLQAERLVVAMPLRGFVVAPMSAAELTDTTDTRILIEAEALRRSIAAGGADWAAGVRDTLASLLAAVGGGDGPRIETLHHAFHRALIGGCGSARLTELFERLYSESERYRFHALTVEAREGSRDVSAEHCAIAEAALAGDAAAAVEALTAHYRRTETVMKSLLPDPAPAAPRRRVRASGSAAPA